MLTLPTASTDEKKRKMKRERERYGERKMETSTLRVEIRKEIKAILYI